ncbi:MAG TPA: TonB-dependent receptor [Steroidobacteraceae bacterium]|nr:TonB-dependent receptor [Steroidobacteraceae bacterium]
MQPTQAGTRPATGAGGRQRPRASAAAALAVTGVALAPAAGAADSHEPALPEVVVGATALPGTAAAPDALPGEVRSVELPARGPGATLTDALAGRFAGIGLEDPLGDRLQGSLAYRGFAASPVLGTPQGLAVYQDGVRLNEAFGDVVNWDLLPAFAVRRVDVVGASPVYGANALGGAVLFTMKNGATDAGLAAQAEGGAFAARALTVEYGRQAGALALYLGGRALEEDGWRRFSPNSLRQLYADLRWAGARGTVALTLSAGSDRLDGPGAAPVQELAVSRDLTFTGPQQVRNRLGLAALHADSRLGASLSLAATAYYRHLQQELDNGNTTAYVPCVANAQFLCQPDGLTPLATVDGGPAGNPAGGAAVPLGQNDAESVTANSRGGSLQLAAHPTLAGHAHALALGVALDASAVEFAAAAQVGVIDPALQLTPGGPVIATPEGTPFAATPVALGVRTRTSAWHASDAVTLADGLTLTASAQYATQDIELADRRGSALSGASRYQRLNPALGLSYRAAAGPTVYAGYAETTRAPSPSEIACSDPGRPCLLPSTLAGDPPQLRQVVARTWEAGVRQARDAAGVAGLGFSAGAFRAALADDIYGVATGTGTGYYANIGATRRQGLSADVEYQGAAGSLYASGALVEATFQDALVMPSPQNPHADANGDIAVRPGAQLPGIARLRASFGGEWRASATLRVGATVTAAGPSYYHGDESNQNPRLPGYARLDLHATLAAGAHVELSLALLNVLDARYATTGLYADPTGVGAPGVPATPAEGPVDYRFQTPAAPFAWHLALRVRL